MRTVSSPAKTFRLGRKTVRLSRAGRAKLLLPIPKKVRNPIRVALAARKRVVATVVVQAIYASGTATARRKIKLKR